MHASRTGARAAPEGGRQHTESRKTDKLRMMRDRNWRKSTKFREVTVYRFGLMDGEVSQAATSLALAEIRYAALQGVYLKPDAVHLSRCMSDLTDCCFSCGPFS